MTIPAARKVSIALLGIVAIIGCDQQPGGSVRSAETDGATGPAQPAPILAPFAGNWTCSSPKTLARWKADGVPAAEIAQASSSGLMHPDMQLTGDLAILPGPVPLEGEYKFFALHPHGNWICGKAWHHEDRHDPGDMDKPRVRLQRDGADLLLAIRIPEAAVNPSDPDITNMPQTAGSATTCDSDSPPTPHTPWRTFVFEPKQPSR